MKIITTTKHACERATERFGVAPYNARGFLIRMYNEGTYFYTCEEGKTYYYNKQKQAILVLKGDMITTIYRREKFHKKSLSDIFALYSEAIGVVEEKIDKTYRQPLIKEWFALTREVEKMEKKVLTKELQKVKQGIRADRKLLKSIKDQLKDVEQQLAVYNILLQTKGEFVIDKC